MVSWEERGTPRLYSLREVVRKPRCGRGSTASACMSLGEAATCGGRAALGGGPAPRTVCLHAPAFLPASAPAPLSMLPLRLVCPVLGGGSQAGRADPLASPWLPRKCSWWPFQEPTSADPRGEGPGAGGPGGWPCLPLPGALVPTLPPHPPTHRRSGPDTVHG